MSWCEGARLERSVGVQVQILFAPMLEFGVVEEVFDDRQGSQPLVRLTSGTVGAVTLIESERLPPQAICIKQLAHKPFVAAVPLGVECASKVVAQVASVLDEKAAPPVVALTSTDTGEEIIAQLSSLMVPFTLSNSVQAGSRQPQVTYEASAKKRQPQSSVPASGAWGSSLRSTAHGTPAQGGCGLAVRKPAPEGHRHTSDGAPLGGAATRELQEIFSTEKSCGQDGKVDSSDAGLDLLTPKLAALFEQCRAEELDFNAAESLAMLVEDVTVQQILRILRMFPNSLEAAANALLQDSGADAAPPAAPAAAPALHADDPVPLGSLAINDEPAAPLWAPKLQKKARRRGLKVGGFFPPTVLEGSDTVTHSRAHDGAQQQRTADGYSLPQQQPRGGSTLRPHPQTGSGQHGGADAVGGPHAVRNGTGHGRDPEEGELPAFLLPFIEEHVCAVESQAAKQESEAQETATWTHVSGKRSTQAGAKKATSPEQVVNLYSAKFRASCAEELKRIMERAAERHRILTLCSSAASQRRIYDKSLIERLESCTEWINEHKDDVLDAYVLAAKNTQLGSVTNACATIDLHFMDKDTAYNVVAYCIEALMEGHQQGQLQLITGRGTHSSNKQANLKRIVLQVLQEYGLSYCEPGRNTGAMVVDIR